MITSLISHSAQSQLDREFAAAHDTWLDKFGVSNALFEARMHIIASSPPSTKVRKYIHSYKWSLNSGQSIDL